MNNHRKEAYLNQYINNLSEEELLQMNITLFDCFSQNKAIKITYFENGVFNQYCGVIEKIDVVNKEIFLIPRKRFLIPYISKIAIK